MTNATQKPETPNRVERVASAASVVPPSPQPLVQNSIAPSRVEDAPLLATSSTGQPPKPSQDRVEPAVTTMANPEMAREPDPVAAVRKTEGRKVVDRVERWKIERRKWAERKRRQQELEAALAVRRNPNNIRQIVDRDEVPLPGSGVFGDD